MKNLAILRITLKLFILRGPMERGQLLLKRPIFFRKQGIGQDYTHLRIYLALWKELGLIGKILRNNFLVNLF